MEQIEETGRTKTYADMVTGAVHAPYSMEDDGKSEEKDMGNIQDTVPEKKKMKERRFKKKAGKSEIEVVDMGDGLFNIVINESAKKELWKPWWKFLIVKLLGKKISYAIMKRRIQTMWGRFGDLDVIDLGNEFYLVKFYAEEDLDHVLLEGPWKIYDHYPAVRLWEPNFNPPPDIYRQNYCMDQITGTSYRALQ
ncbi:Endonuclease/exonuclease/phosphatase [Arachis hypogaea]|nr:Endonuclease/exonuclease/phosphatase [Arachis hypogaea]